MSSLTILIKRRSRTTKRTSLTSLSLRKTKKRKAWHTALQILELLSYTFLQPSCWLRDIGLFVCHSYAGLFVHCFMGDCWWTDDNLTLLYLCSYLALPWERRVKFQAQRPYDCGPGTVPKAGFIVSRFFEGRLYTSYPLVVRLASLYFSAFSYQFLAQWAADHPPHISSGPSYLVLWIALATGRRSIDLRYLPVIQFAGFLVFHLWSYDRFQCLRWNSGRQPGAFKRVMTVSSETFPLLCTIH